VAANPVAANIPWDSRYHNQSADSGCSTAGSDGPTAD